MKTNHIQLVDKRQNIIAFSGIGIRPTNIISNEQQPNTKHMRTATLPSAITGRYKARTQALSGVAQTVVTTLISLVFTRAKQFVLLLLLGLMIGFVQQGLAQTVVLTNPSSPWTVPAGVTSIKVEVWGGGGAGGAARFQTANSRGGGGGGGSYSQVTWSVTPLSSYTISIGSGGTGITRTDGSDGGKTTVSGSAGTISANGGIGGKYQASGNGNGGNGGAGGTYNGGTGATATGSGISGGGSGGGGGGAGNGSNGSNGTVTAGGNGGTGTYGGGKGANGFTSGNDGAAGSAPGGGGSGAYTGLGGDRPGGSGGAGQVVITYTAPYVAQFTAMNTGSSAWCEGETRIITVAVKNIGSATWTDATPDINIGVKWNADADYNVRTDANGLAPGATQTYSLMVTAPSSGTNNLSFDMVNEGNCWFAGNSGLCGPGNSVYTSSAININKVPAQPSVIEGSAIPCVGSSQSYNVTNISGVSYAWTFPPGWVQTGGTTTNSITVTIGPVSGDVQVVPSLASCTGTARILTATVSVPATPTATGRTICKGTTTTLTASGAVSGDKYKWYGVATGGTPLKTSTNNTDNTYLTATLTNTTSYWVSVLTSADCESSRTPVTVTVSNPVSSVYNHTNITCYGGHDGSITILASGGTSSSYQFSVDNGATYTSGTNPNPYTFNGLNANTPYKIRVKDSNECASPLILP